MKKILILGTLLLGCCLAAVAQTGSSTNQDQQGAAPSAYSQDQTVQTPSEQAPSAQPPDSNAPEQSMQAAPTATSQIATVQGCLSQSADGFMLSDNLGNNYQLGGDTSQLASLTGKEVQVSGMTISNGAPSPGAMSSDNADSAGSAAGAQGSNAQISVTKVRKIADVCSAGSATGK